MEQPRIALVNASFSTHDTRRNFSREVDASIVESVAIDGAVPEDLDVDGAIITGSRASVYWDEPWIEQTREWTADAIEAGIPILGVCWGHQLVADALGGEVADMGLYEIGYRPVTHNGSSRLFDGIDREFLAFQTHSDEVVDVPPDAEVVARSETSIQAYSGDGYWGVQFHPEYDMSTARTVTEAKDDIDSERKQRALASITEENFQAAGESKLVFENFLKTIVPERKVV